jgi:hypothetical protein
MGYRFVEVQGKIRGYICTAFAAKVAKWPKTTTLG